ncbi:L-threonylcarbamoyladenylate synthase [Paenibacillus protaetiae]|uniref:Threonylcarbamoyl-AMP synthase n=1 Tax=Paenibacillus protaetiae TaxID=2509456 RepID=A0A4P6EXA5_9BACL|nr:L-threonylcarbamoyladenylate synthase [Paenibacillus protaetiae]QAY67694.1 threonylcarbamoyl-AMP synthase [Paenibacillus protaetiae]
MKNKTKRTKVWPVTLPADVRQLQEAADLLRSGGLVAFPTETVYGLGADARNTEAIRQVFEAKGRPSDNPLIVHIADKSQLDALVLPYPELAGRLMDAFWPGPLTFVLPVIPGAVSPLVTAGLDTVGVRMPDHPAALALIRQSGCPLAGPSANKSGRPSPTEAGHVLDDLDGRIGGVVDGGACGVGLESTVIQITGEDGVRILRPGGITPEQLEQAAPGVRIDAPTAAGEQTEAPRSPGMKYTHYAPHGEMVIVCGEPSAVAACIRKEAGLAKARGETTGVLAFAEHAAEYEADVVLSCGSKQELGQAAAGLYASLRHFDEAGIQRIWAEGCPEEGLGLALMNRLRKAAGGQVIRV